MGGGVGGGGEGGEGGGGGESGRGPLTPFDSAKPTQQLNLQALEPAQGGRGTASLGEEMEAFLRKYRGNRGFLKVRGGGGRGMKIFPVLWHDLLDKAENVNFQGSFNTNRTQASPPPFANSMLA